MGKVGWILGIGAALYWWVYRGYKALVMRFDSLTFGGLDIVNDTVTLYMNLVMRNPLIADLYLAGVRGKLYVQDVLVSDVDADMQMVIGSNKLLQVGIPVPCKLSGISEAIRDNILSGDIRTLTVRFDGVIDMGKKVSVPLPITITKDWSSIKS